MTTLSNLARIIVLLALTAALAACSAIKLGYNNLDQVTFWWLDSYVDFTDEQSTQVREDLARLHAWHRKEELARFAEMLRAIEPLMSGEISPSQACRFVPQVRERLSAVADRAEPAVVTLAMGLSADQLVHLERKYGKNNAQYRKEWVTLAPERLKEKRFEQFLKRSEMIYGRLDEPQRAALRQQLERSIFDPGRIAGERRRRQQDALQTLRKVAGQPIAISEARALLRAYLARVQESPDPSYRGYQHALIDEGCRTFSVLHSSTSLAQREAAAQRLRAYQRDLRELSEQP
jgi:hypothetical protein